MSRIRFVDITDGTRTARVAETSVRVWAKKGWRRVDEPAPVEDVEDPDGEEISASGVRRDSPLTLEEGGRQSASEE